MDQKSRRLEEMKSLLSQAKVRLETYQVQLDKKDKQIADLTLRLQRVEKYEQSIWEATKRLRLTFPNEKQAIDSIEQLCTLEKLREANSELQNAVLVDKGVNDLRKQLVKLLSSLYLFLDKRRQIRLSFVKKQISFKKSIQVLEAQIKQKDIQAARLAQEITSKVTEHKKQLDLQRHEYSKRVPKDEVNIEYLRNIFTKLFVGTPESVKMSLKVLHTLLKLSEAEYKAVEKHFKF